MSDDNNFDDDIFIPELDHIEAEIKIPNEDINILMKDYSKKRKKYKTVNKLTKYERTKILSERASQIDDGSAIFIEDYSSYDNAYEIACEELKQQKIPFIIKRPYGNTFEYWKLNDLL